LKKFNKKILGIALNRVKGESYELSVKDVESTCKSEVIVKIPEDKKVPESISRGVPTVISYPNSAFSNSIKILASKVLGEYVEVSTVDKIKEIFKGLFKG
jgi:MinD-like ATPase involved in chromosome partitioning or flagellar assembly